MKNREGAGILEWPLLTDRMLGTAVFSFSISQLLFERFYYPPSTEEGTGLRTFKWLAQGHTAHKRRLELWPKSSRLQNSVWITKWISHTWIQIPLSHCLDFIFYKMVTIMINNNSTYHRGFVFPLLFWGFTAIVIIKYLTWFPECSKCSIKQ